MGSMSFEKVHIVGSGLAGSEAAYFLAERGIQVFLHEMRPKKMTEAHETDQCAELVCSNSLKSQNPASGPGMLKAEMREVGSLILHAAAEAAVPGGDALAVDRDLFASSITQAIKAHPNITLLQGEEVTAPFEDAPTLFATGPLTSPDLSKWIAQVTGEGDLYFYDAIAPILDAESLDRDKIFLANRYDKGDEEAYLNCPFSTKEEYDTFIDALLAAETIPPNRFEAEKFFQGCQPIEAIAEKGRESLRFGPMKPVGLTNPKTGEKPYAVIQLRPENNALTAYNMVGFQTKLRYGEQKRIFRMIPGLEKAEFLRLGSIHRNTYVCGPKVLRSDLSLKGKPGVYLAGQITGVEGYLESSACGMLAGMFLHQRLKKQPHSAPPSNSALGALLGHVISGNIKSYQPTNIHFGLFDPRFFENVVGQKKAEARQMMADQARVNFRNWWKSQEV
jgi:methylenetetrahydrofolate--tRNA-(uracil-5-)-methyltransferase